MRCTYTCLIGLRSFGKAECGLTATDDEEDKLSTDSDSGILFYLIIVLFY